MNRPRALAGSATILALAATMTLASLDAAGSPAYRRSAGGTIPPDRPGAALLPLENLSGREEQGFLFTRVFFAHLAASGALEMVDPSRVEEALDSLGIRSSGSLTPAQIRSLGDSLHVPYLLIGSVLESGRVQSSGVDLPAVGATLRLVQAQNGRVMWAGVDFRSGEDRETVFGWGRVNSTERLVEELATELLRDFREAGDRYRKTRTEAGR